MTSKGWTAGLAGQFYGERESSAVVSNPVPLGLWFCRPAPYQLVHAAVSRVKEFVVLDYDWSFSSHAVQPTKLSIFSLPVNGY